MTGFEINKIMLKPEIGNFLIEPLNNSFFYGLQGCISIMIFIISLSFCHQFKFILFQHLLLCLTKFQSIVFELPNLKV